MRRLFNLFIKEEKIDLKVAVSLQDLSIKFNTWLYQINKDTGKRRFSSKERTNQFTINKWVTRWRVEDKKLNAVLG